MSLISLLRKVRPAPLQVFLLGLLRANRRRIIGFGEYRFFADPTSNFGASLLQGGYEPALSDVIRHYLRPGMKFLDLGANEGFFSVFASRIVGPSGQVVAVEPQSRLAPVIQKNLTLNDCLNCRVVQCAVSDHDGEVILNLAPSTNTGSTSIYQVTRYPVAQETVRSFSLEHLVSLLGVGNFDMVKVDMEGAEYDVFLAAGTVLRSGVLKRIALEFHIDILLQQGSAPETLHEHMLACGYVLEMDEPRVYAFRAQV